MRESTWGKVEIGLEIGLVVLSKANEHLGYVWKVGSYSAVLLQGFFLDVGDELPTSQLTPGTLRVSDWVLDNEPNVLLVEDNRLVLEIN